MKDGGIAENTRDGLDSTVIPSPMIYAATRLYKPPVAQRPASKTGDRRDDDLTPTEELSTIGRINKLPPEVASKIMASLTASMERHRKWMGGSMSLKDTLRRLNYIDEFDDGAVHFDFKRYSRDGREWRMRISLYPDQSMSQKYRTSARTDLPIEFEIKLLPNGDFLLPEFNLRVLQQ